MNKKIHYVCYRAETAKKHLRRKRWVLQGTDENLDRLCVYVNKLMRHYQDQDDMVIRFKKVSTTIEVVDAKDAMPYIIKHGITYAMGGNTEH